MAGSHGRMTMKVIGQSALGRDLFLVTVNAMDTVQQRQDFQAWEQVRKVALTDPVRGQNLLASYGDYVKVPLFIQAGIHGNEYEGVDAVFRTLDRLATTPYVADPEVDAVLNHTVLLFNVVQNPDGRIAGVRANGNGFDLNRDFLTQAQSETRASVSIMQEWLPPETLDLHGYVTPTLVEATTKPHNPSIDYDLWLKWNQTRIDANEAALAAHGFGITRPVNQWCSDAEAPPNGICDNGEPAGPAEAEGWDDWGPFYTPMYSQHTGLNGSTVEMCNRIRQVWPRYAGAIHSCSNSSHHRTDTCSRLGSRRQTRRWICSQSVRSRLWPTHPADGGVAWRGRSVPGVNWSSVGARRAGWS